MQDILEAQNKGVILLEMGKWREKTKKEKLALNNEVFQKRYALNDWEGKMIMVRTKIC